MELKAQYTIEAALLVPLLIVLLLGVFTAGGKLYGENGTLIDALAGQELAVCPHEAVRGSYQKGELLWKLGTNGN